jgi:hypothetical protein
VAVGFESTAGLSTAERPFTVLNPQAVITNLDPGSSAPGAAAMTLDVHGSEFIDGARVIWNGEERETTYVNSTLLQIDLSAADLEKEIVIPVAVLNPEPRAAPSATAYFHIAQPIDPIFDDSFE